MSGATPAPWSIPYPSGTDRVMDGDNAMQAIAERVAALNSSQWKLDAVGVTNVSMGSGWTDTGTYYMIRSGWVFLRIMAGRATWVGGSPVCYLPSTVAPTYSLYAPCIGQNSGAFVPLSVDTTGTVTTIAPNPASTNGIYGIASWPIK